MFRFRCACWLTVAGIALLPSCTTVERQLSRIQRQGSSVERPEMNVRRRNLGSDGLESGELAERPYDPGMQSPQQRLDEHAIVLTTGQTGDAKREVRLPRPLAPPAFSAEDSEDVETPLPVAAPASETLLTLETLEQ